MRIGVLLEVFIVVIIFLGTISLIFASRKHNRLTVGIGRHPAMALVVLAQKLDLYSKYNLSVDIQQYTFGREALDAVISGKADLGVAFETPFVLKLSQGFPIKTYTTIHTSHLETYIITPQKSSIKKFIDLKHKKVGLTKGTNAELFINSIAWFEDFSISDINLINASPEHLISLYQKGEIDAMVWNLSKMNLPQTILSDRFLYLDSFNETTVLIANRTTTPQQKELHTKFIKALIEAENYYYTSPNQAREIITTSFNLPNNELATEFFEHTSYYLGLSNLLLTNLNYNLRWLNETGKINSKNVPILEAIDKSILSLVKPDSITATINE